MRTKVKLSHIIIAASLLLDLYLANSIYEDLSGFFAQRESTQQYVSNNATNAR